MPGATATSATIRLSGMTCGHCVATVERALLETVGVHAATADLATQSASVEYDSSRTSEATIRGAAAAAGYPPRSSAGLVSIESAETAKAGARTSGAEEQASTPSEATLSIAGMTCGSCVRSVEDAAMGVPGARKCEVNLTESSARIVFDPQRADVEGFIRAIEDAGYGAARQEGASGALESGRSGRSLQLRLAVSAVLTAPLLVLAMSHGLLDFPGATWVQFALALPVMFYGGAPFFSGAWTAARHGRADMNTLVAVGTGVAFAYSVVALAIPERIAVHGMAPVYFETSAAIITLVLVGRLLEARARRRTSSSIRKLLALEPETVRVRRNGTESVVRLADVAIGDEVAVRPGERIPVDGSVIEGEGAVDESPITGESVPSDKSPGSSVVSGSLNLDGFLVFRAEQVGSDTALSRIIAFVRRAQGSKSPAARLADRIAAVFVPAIIVAALFTFAGWMLAGPAESALRMAINNSVSVLIIACPCALGLATPAALAVGIGRAAERGILVRDGESLEVARRLQTVVFDKTGTLTLGRFRVTDTVAFGSLPPGEVTSSAASVEALSEHPLARAIAAEGTGKASSVEKFQALPGAGASGELEGRSWLVGNAGLLASRRVDLSPPRMRSTGSRAKENRWS